MNCSRMKKVVVSSVLLFLCLLSMFFVVVSDAGRSWKRKKLDREQKILGLRRNDIRNPVYDDEYDDVDRNDSTEEEVDLDNESISKLIDDKKRDKRYLQQQQTGPLYGTDSCGLDYTCCEDPYCAPYCYKCQSNRVVHDRIFYRLPCKARDRTFDVLGNVVCKDKNGSNGDDSSDSDSDSSDSDSDSSEERDRANAGARSTTMATTTESSSSEEERSRENAQPNSNGNNGNDTVRGQLEFTHHIYEEYLPILPERSKSPIILQSIPQYSVANYFSLNRHQHPFLSHHPPQLPPTPPSSPYRPHHYQQHQQRGSPSASSDISLLHHYQQERKPYKPKNPLFYEDMRHKLLKTSPHYSYKSPHTREISSLRPSFESDATIHNPILFSNIIPPSEGHLNQQPPIPLHQDGQSFFPNVNLEASNHANLLSPLLNPNVPQPQTVILNQNRPLRDHPPAQPVLKYHLIRHSFPAEGKKEYFADIPAFLPGPPYVEKALPSRRKPTILRRPNRSGYLHGQKGKKNTQKKKKGRGNHLGKIVKRLIG